MKGFISHTCKNTEPVIRRKTLPKLFNRYRIISSSLSAIQKNRLMYETHLRSAANQYNIKMKKIQGSIWFEDASGRILLKADLINK